jgi:hypothetical protein
VRVVGGIEQGVRLLGVKPTSVSTNRIASAGDARKVRTRPFRFE